MMEKFAARNPSCMQYDYVLQSYLKDEEEIKDQRVHFFVNCIRLNLKPLKQSVLEHAHSWLTSLGGLLNESTHNQLKGLQEIVERGLFVCISFERELIKDGLWLKMNQHETFTLKCP